MPDEAAGFEPEDPQGEWLDDHAAATLLAMKAEHEGKQDTRWTCTRPELEAALRETAHGRHLTPGALTALAGAILARLPEAVPGFSDVTITAEPGESLLSLPDSAYPPGATPLRTLASSMPATAGVLRSQVDAAIEEWEGDPLMRLADALMSVAEPVLGEVAAQAAEIHRLRQALADKDGEIAILKGQVTS